MLSECTDASGNNHNKVYPCLSYKQAITVAARLITEKYREKTNDWHKERMYENAVKNDLFPLLPVELTATMHQDQLKREENFKNRSLEEIKRKEEELQKLKDELNE